MNNKNMAQPSQEDQNLPDQKISRELNKKPGDTPVKIYDDQEIAENQHRQENKERSGKKSSGAGEETLGIP